MAPLVVAAFVLTAPQASDSEVTRQRSPRYGISLEVPNAWPIVVREQDDRVLVALIPQASDPDRPGVLACEMAIAPESLYEYQRRIAGAGRPGQLVCNDVIATSSGPRLETTREFQPEPDVKWFEHSVRWIANRQLYTVILSCRKESFADVRPWFEKVLGSLEFSLPDTGAAAADAARNRWLQREFRFAIDLPRGWNPVLAPAEIALFYASAPARGIWADNCLVIAHEHRAIDLEEQARLLPDQLRTEEPGCEVLQCLLVKQGKRQALETVVRTRRGPFSMTVLERRFAGERFDYEVKYTLESDRFDALAPELRRSADSFEEAPGPVPGGGRPA